MHLPRNIWLWTIAIGVGIYVFGLTFYAETRKPEAPGYAFYEKAVVHVILPLEESETEVFARYNTILRGANEIVPAQSIDSGNFRLPFKVISPRPALLFAGAHKLQIFLIPGDSSLEVRLYPAAHGADLDSVVFSGETAGICEYLYRKSRHFGNVNLRLAPHTLDDPDDRRYFAKLDSLAARELAYLAEQEIYMSLPSWFAAFEKNDILYQKAYLKLARSLNRDDQGLRLDPVPLNNQAAVFSYYYYLYLMAWFASQDSLSPELNPQSASADSRQSRLDMADRLLTGEVHDVFLTRHFFACSEGLDSASGEELLENVAARFKSQRYHRYVLNEWEQNFSGGL